MSPSLHGCISIHTSLCLPHYTAVLASIHHYVSLITRLYQHPYIIMSPSLHGCISIHTSFCLTHQSKLCQVIYVPPITISAHYMSAPICPTYHTKHPLCARSYISCISFYAPTTCQVLFVLHITLSTHYVPGLICLAYHTKHPSCARSYMSYISY